MVSFLHCSCMVLPIVFFFIDGLLSTQQTGTFHNPTQDEIAICCQRGNFASARMFQITSSKTDTLLQTLSRLLAHMRVSVSLHLYYSILTRGHPHISEYMTSYYQDTKKTCRHKWRHNKKTMVSHNEGDVNSKKSLVRNISPSLPNYLQASKDLFSKEFFLTTSQKYICC